MAKVIKYGNKTQARAGYINSLKKECVACGYSGYAGCLELHHMNRDKGGYFSNMRDVSEIAYEIYTHPVIVLCRNCHGEVHFGVRDEWEYEDFILGADCSELPNASNVKSKKTRPVFDPDVHVDFDLVCGR